MIVVPMILGIVEPEMRKLWSKNAYFVIFQCQDPFRFHAHYIVVAVNIVC